MILSSIFNYILTCYIKYYIISTHYYYMGGNVIKMSLY